jgi:hypothetical protein
MVTPPIDAQHLQRLACLYVRQSTLQPMFENTESTAGFVSNLVETPFPPLACFELGCLQAHQLSVHEAPSAEDELAKVAAGNPAPVLAQPHD